MDDNKLLLETSDAELANEYLRGVDSTEVRRSGFGGESEIIAFLIGAGPLAIDKIVSLYRAHQEKNRFIKITIDGIEISGISEKEVKKILAEKFSRDD